MKTMGEHAEVQIEPDEQTRLLDETSKRCTGVIGGGVPGAGGYDAIWTLVVDIGTADSPENQVRQVWKSWTEMSVSSLSRKARVVGSIAAQQGSGSGLMLHSLTSVQGLAASVKSAS